MYLLLPYIREMSAMSFPRSILLILALSVVAACGSDTTTDPQPQTTIAVSSGNAQSAQSSQALASPIVVRVARDGAALAGTSVSWSVASGGGSVAPATSTTGGDGLASTTWTLGPSAGANTLQASSAGANGSPVTFTATATGPAPTQANVSVGDNFFDPTAANVAAGGQVTWTWNGAVTHNVTFPAGTNSSNQASGTFTRTFATAGTFNYLCTIHGAAMSGQVVVQ